MATVSMRPTPSRHDIFRLTMTFSDYKSSCLLFPTPSHYDISDSESLWLFFDRTFFTSTRTCFLSVLMYSDTENYYLQVCIKACTLCFYSSVFSIALRSKFSHMFYALCFYL